MKLTYGISDKPKGGQLIVFAIQQLLAILAATIAVPNIVNASVEGANMSQSAALFGAGVGTIVYLLFTKFKSPVFLGSSFAFIGSMIAAFAGGVSMSAGYLGLIIGALFAGAVYVVISIIVKLIGVKWIDKFMPPVVIGPTVAIIGLSLAGNAISQAVSSSQNGDGAYVMDAHGLVCLFCALVTLFAVVISSVYGKKLAKLIPFIIGIGCGYVVAAVFTVIGTALDIESLMIIDFSRFKDISLFSIPDFSFVQALKGGLDFGDGNLASYIGTIAVAYIPVAFVVFAEHIADHKNLSSIIEKDLLDDPGLSRTLLGDGVCITLYGFIAVSGLKMVQSVDLGENRNLFTVSAVLIAGVGGMKLAFGKITLTGVACALILGIIVNLVLGGKDTNTK